MTDRPKKDFLFKMDIPKAAESDHKICLICVQPNCDDIYTLCEIIEGVSLGSMLKHILIKLELPESENLATGICSTCREELPVVYRFIEKVEKASLKNSNFESYDFEPDHSDPLQRPVRKDEICVKLEIEEDRQIEQIYFENDEPDIKDIEPVKPSRKRSKPKKSNTRTNDTDSGSDFVPNEPEDEAASSEGDEKAKPKRASYAIKPDSQPRRCCDCKEPLSTQEQVEEHSEKMHQRNKITDLEEIERKPVECPVCFQRFEKKKDYVLHQRKMYANVLHCCKRCPAEFANAYNLRVHWKDFHKSVKIIHEIDKMRQNIHKCCVCRKQFDTRDLLQEHGKKIHLPKRENDQSDNQFQCEICFRRFKTESVLIEHQRRPFRRNRYQCAHCGKTFKDKQSFTDHEQSHTNLRPYVCPICNKGFSLKPNFRTHVKYHSVPDDQYKCEHCGKGFKKKHLLQEHSKIHSQSENRPFKCTICPNTFTRQILLDSHIKEHMGEKPFKCTKCTASYIHERDLRRHTRVTHEGIRPFICLLCGRGFARRDALGKHSKSHKNELQL